MINQKESGFSVVELIIIVVIIGVIAVVVFLIYKDHHNSSMAKGISKSVTLNSKSTTSPNQTTNLNVATVTSKVNSFYNSYIGCINSGNLNQACTLSVVKAEGTANLVAYNIPPSGYSYPVDPIICAQASPNSVAVSDVVTTKDNAVGTVTEKYDTGPITLKFSVVNNSGNLKIDTITCNPILKPTLILDS